ncbi:structural protein [Acrididae reovirus]|nr:structural protein [Acrididae reovirus]
MDGLSQKQKKEVIELILALRDRSYVNTTINTLLPDDFDRLIERLRVFFKNNDALSEINEGIAENQALAAKAKEDLYNAVNDRLGQGLFGWRSLDSIAGFFNSRYDETTPCIPVSFGFRLFFFPIEIESDIGVETTLLDCQLEVPLSVANTWELFDSVIKIKATWKKETEENDGYFHLSINDNVYDQYLTKFSFYYAHYYTTVLTRNSTSLTNSRIGEEKYAPYEYQGQQYQTYLSSQILHSHYQPKMYDDVEQYESPVVTVDDRERTYLGNDIVTVDKKFLCQPNADISLGFQQAYNISASLGVSSKTFSDIKATMNNEDLTNNVTSYLNEKAAYLNLMMYDYRIATLRDEFISQSVGTDAQLTTVNQANVKELADAISKALIYEDLQVEASDINFDAHVPNAFGSEEWDEGQTFYKSWDNNVKWETDNGGYANNSGLDRYWNIRGAWPTPLSDYGNHSQMNRRGVAPRWINETKNFELRSNQDGYGFYANFNLTVGPHTNQKVVSENKYIAPAALNMDYLFSPNIGQLSDSEKPTYGIAINYNQYGTPATTDITATMPEWSMEDLVLFIHIPDTNVAINIQNSASTTGYLMCLGKRINFNVVSWSSATYRNQEGLEMMGIRANLAETSFKWTPTSDDVITFTYRGDAFPNNETSIVAAWEIEDFVEGVKIVTSDTVTLNNSDSFYYDINMAIAPGSSIDANQHGTDSTLYFYMPQGKRNHFRYYYPSDGTFIQMEVPTECPDVADLPRTAINGGQYYSRVYVHIDKISALLSVGKPPTPASSVYYIDANESLLSLWMSSVETLLKDIEERLDSVEARLDALEEQMEAFILGQEIEAALQLFGLVAPLVLKGAQAGWALLKKVTSKLVRTGSRYMKQLANAFGNSKWKVLNELAATAEILEKDLTAAIQYDRLFYYTGLADSGYIDAVGKTIAAEIDDVLDEATDLYMHSPTSIAVDVAEEIKFKQAVEWQFPTNAEIATVSEHLDEVQNLTPIANRPKIMTPPDKVRFMMTPLETLGDKAGNFTFNFTRNFTKELDSKLAAALRKSNHKVVHTYVEVETFALDEAGKLKMTTAYAGVSEGIQSVGATAGKGKLGHIQFTSTVDGWDEKLGYSLTLDDFSKSGYTLEELDKACNYWLKASATEENANEMWQRLWSRLRGRAQGSEEYDYTWYVPKENLPMVKAMCDSWDYDYNLLSQNCQTFCNELRSALISGPDHMSDIVPDHVRSAMVKARLDSMISSQVARQVHVLTPWFWAHDG